MRTKSSALVVGLVLGASAAWIFHASTPASSAPSATTIAVVDVRQVMDAAKDSAGIEARTKAKRDEIQTWGNAQEEKVKQAEKTLRLTPASDPKRTDLEHEAAKLKTETEFEYKWRVNEALRSYFDEKAALYDKVRGAITTVAAQKGYNLVLYKMPEGEALRLDEKSQGAFLSNVAIRVVLHSSNEIDITQDVIDFVK